MRGEIARGRTFSWIAGILLGGAGAGLLFLSAMYVFGTNVICVQGVLCDLAGYRNVGAASGIHLVGTADPYTELSVVWETPGEQNPPTVQFRRVGTADWSDAHGNSLRAPPNGIVASSSRIHQVRISGLEPGTRYQYRVSWDPRSQHKRYSPTFLAHTLARSAPIKLAFVSDICLRNRPDGRSGPIDEIMRNLQRDDVDLILGGGDYGCAVDDGRYATTEPVIQRFFDEWQAVFSSVPFIAQYGNHDCCHGEKTEFWSPRLNLTWAPFHTPDGRSFAFDLADARIVGFYGTGAHNTVPTEHVTWLDETLADARARGQQHLVVFQHASLFGTGRAHPPEEAMRRQLVPVLEQRQVDLFLSAHDMAYERTLPLTAAADGQPDSGSLAETARGAWNGVVYAKVSPTGRATGIENSIADTRPSHIAVADDDHFFYATLVLPGNGGPMEYTAYAFDRRGQRRVIDHFSVGT